MTKSAESPWRKVTAETNLVEQTLKAKGFENVTAYRYNPGSIRVRVIDPRFEGRSIEACDGLVEEVLKELPDSIQADIISLYTFAPSDLDRSPMTFKAALLNEEFENPSPSRL